MRAAASSMANGKPSRRVHNLGNETRIGRGKLEGGLDCLSALQEESHRGRVGEGFRRRQLCEVGDRQGWDRKRMFTLDMQYGTTGHQQFQVGARGQQTGQVRGCRQDLFEVVENEQQMSLL